MMDEKETRVTFADEPGLRAARILRSFVDQGVMKDWTRLQGEQAFISGRVGFYAASTSWLKGVQDKTSGFAMKTSLFPVGTTGKRILPNGGSHGAFGMAGGKPGEVGLNRVVRANGEVEQLGHIGQAQMHAGDIFEISTPGGGGYGA